MSQDLNQCQFIGRLGRDAETRFMPNGDAVTNFSIAVGETYKAKDSGEKVENTEWVRCVAWRKLGEICGEYLKKGQQVYVSGKMKTRKYQDKDGQEKYITEIVLDRMQMLGSKSDSRERDDGERPEPKTTARPAAGGAKGSFADPFDDTEIPF